MSVIVRNDYGAVAVNKGVIERMIIEDMLGMSDVLLLCNKKGKLIKDKPTPLIDPDYYDAVDVSDKKGHVTVKVYVILEAGCSISEIAEEVFGIIERDFEMLRLERPECAVNVGNSFKSKQGNRPPCRYQEGRRGSKQVVLGTSVFPSREPSVSGNFCGRIKGSRGNPGPPAVEAWSVSYWITRGIPFLQ